MDDKSIVDDYIDYINDKILPFIDYDKLQTSYSTDMTYAKGVLNLLHLAMVKVYGDRTLDENNGEDGYVVIPGVVRGKQSGNMALALLDLDLSSSGEHYGTSFLCKYGIISQSGDRNDPTVKEICASIGSYDYCYTATIPGDIHVENSRLPKELKSVLNDFHKYKVSLSHPPDKPDKSDKKPSLLEGIRDAEKEIKEKSNDKPDTKKKEPEH